MYSHEGIFSCERRSEVINVICVLASLGRDKYI